MSINQSYGQFSAWINKRPIVVSVIVLLIIAASLVAIYHESNPVEKPVPIFSAYFYDLETGRVFVAQTDEPPPIAVPGAAAGAKKTGVKANVFACHDCADEKDRFVAFVEEYTPDAKARLLAMSGDTTTKPATNPSFEDMERGHLLGKPDPKNPDWKNQFCEFMSPQGNKIMESTQKTCGDTIRPKICMPDQDHMK